MIGLVDCNNFFVSCERLFRPDLSKKPVLVLSSNDGCVVSRSQEVKELGIPMGVPYFQIKDICRKEGIAVFSSNFTLYRDLSRRVMSALRDEFETCEVYSVDEAFFLIKDTMSFSDFMFKRKRIIQKTGIPVSIGVSYTKTLAKVAASIAKKEKGVCVLDHDSWQRLQSSTSCGAIWGIGRETSARLRDMGIGTVYELLASDRSLIRAQFGVIGERTCLELEGVPVYTFGDSVHRTQESYMSTRSFGNVVKDKAVLQTALAYHISELALKLRKDACVAAGMTVLIRGSRHGVYAQRKSLFYKTFTEPTADTGVFLREMHEVLEAVFDPEIPYKKAGVIFHGILPKGASTGSLFSAGVQKVKTKDIDSISDALNDRFGRKILNRGSVFGSALWITKKAFNSKNYTTKWSDLPEVKAI